LEELQIEVSYKGKNDDIAIITARGYIDTITKEEIEEVLLNQLTLGKHKIIIDLKKISYINSSGWGVFLREIKEIREKKGDLVLLNMTADVYDVFETMELSKIIKHFVSLKKAVEYFS
jgi:anti-sigma B factor antagonist